MGLALDRLQQVPLMVTEVEAVEDPAGKPPNGAASFSACSGTKCCARRRQPL